MALAKFLGSLEALVWLIGALRFGIGVAFSRSRHHSFEVSDRFPEHTILPSCSTITRVAVKVAVQPWSHSWPMDMREPEARLGKRCAVHASGGKKGRDNWAVWLEQMVPWFGSKTEMPGCATRLLVYGAVISRKCPVAPVSAMSGDDVVGGSIDVVQVHES